MKIKYVHCEYGEQLLKRSFYVIKHDKQKGMGYTSILNLN